MRIVIMILIVFALNVYNSIAQQVDDISTDRPDQTESPVTLPKGFLQIELGGTYESDKTESAATIIVPAFTGERKAITAPSILLRYGVFSNVELRVAGEYISENIKTTFTPPSTLGSQTVTVSGLSALTIGTKIKLFEEKGSRPDAAFLFSLNIPFKKDAPFQSEYIGAEFRFAMAHELSKRFSLSYNLGGEWDGDNVPVTGIYTLSLGASLVKKLSAFVEVYGFCPQGSSPDHRLDGGFTYLIAKNVQADISGGIGISKLSPDYFIGAGLSVRLPK